jgi:hypothetical protein
MEISEHLDELMDQIGQLSMHVVTCTRSDEYDLALEYTQELIRISAKLQNIFFAGAQPEAIGSDEMDLETVMIAVSDLATKIRAAERAGKSEIANGYLGNLIGMLKFAQEYLLDDIDFEELTETAEQEMAEDSDYVN